MPTNHICIRCGAELEEDEANLAGEEYYCENCFDDMFVSWNDVLPNKETK